MFKSKSVLIAFLVFVVAFSSFSNWAGPYLPNPVKKFTKFTQIRTVRADTVGPNNSGTVAGAGAGSCSDNMTWTINAGGLDANDSTYIQVTGGAFDAGNISDELRISNFGFSLVGNVSSIDGFQVEILGWTPTGTPASTYHTVSLFTTPGSNRGDNKATGNFPTADPGSTYQSFGAANDDWYTTGSWTQAEVESADFGVVMCLTAGEANTTVNVDHVRITVTYTVAAAADLSWDTGAADFEIWAGATAISDASLTWDNGTLICSASLDDNNGSINTCGSINKNQKYRVQVVLKNIGGTAANMAAGDFVDHGNVKTFWAGTDPTISSSDCGFNDVDADNGSTTCEVVFSGNDVRITNTGGGNVQLAATTGTEGFMYLIITDNDVPISDTGTYMNASIDSITEDSSRVTIGVVRKLGLRIRGWIKIRGLVKFR